MSVIQENRDLLLRELRVAKVLPVLRKQLPEFLVGEIENQLTIRRKNEKLLDILRKREDGASLLKLCLEGPYPHLMKIFDGASSSEDENAPPRPPPPKPAAKATPRPSDYRGTNNPSPQVMPKPKISLTPKYPSANGVNKDTNDKDTNSRALRQQLDNKEKKIQELEKELKDRSHPNQIEKDYNRLKTKYENLQREKDMVVTEKLAMETEQSIILKENEFLKKMKSSSIPKREALQDKEDKELAEQQRDEALRDAQRLRRELDDIQYLKPDNIQRQYSDAIYDKDVRDDEKRREARDRNRIEKECEKLREELQEERKHAQKISSSSVPLNQYEKLQDELDSVRRDNRNIARERDNALQEKNSLLMDKKSGDSHEIRNLQDKIEQLKQSLSNTENEMNNISFDNAMLTDQLNSATSKLEAAVKDREAYASQNKLMGEDIEQLIKEREDILDELEGIKKSKTGSLDEKDGTIRSLRGSLNAAQSRNDTLEKKCNEVEGKLEDVKQELRDRNARDNVLQAERDDLKRQVMDLAEKLRQVSKERSELEDGMKKKTQLLEDLERDLKDIRDDKEVISSDHQQALEEIEKLHNHIAQLERGQPVPAASEHSEPAPPPPERALSPPPTPGTYHPEEEDFIEDRDWRSEIKVIILDKATHNSRSFGFTICGGIDNPHFKDQPDDPHIYVLKVQKDGVADGVLRPDDALLSVNGNDLSKVNHTYAVNTLKNSGEVIELVIRRRFLPEQIRTIDLSPYLSMGLGISIIGGKSEDVTQDPGIYIAKVLSGGAAEAEGQIAKDDRILTVNDAYVVNVLRKDVEHLLTNCDDRCVLRVAKPLSSLFPDEPAEVDGPVGVPYNRRGRSTEDLRMRQGHPPNEMYGPPANFRDPHRANMNRAGSTPLLHDERMYQNHHAHPQPLDPLKRSSSQGHLRNRPSGGGFDLQRSRSQDWAPPHMMDPRSYAPSYQIRRVTINRPNLQTSLGLEVYTASSGQSGIFVNKLDKAGLSFGAGLRCADQILEVNGRNLRNASHDEAVGILSKNVNIHLICQQSPKLFGEMHQTMRTGFFVRALYNFTGNPDSGMSFKEGDVLHVVDRESMDHDGWWLGLLLRGVTSIQCGEVPSHHRAVHIIRQRQGGSSEPEPDKRGRKSLINNVFRKDGKGGAGSQGYASDDTADIIPYEPVVRKDLVYCRPIIILGPLTELLNDRLVNDCPEVFNRCILYTTRNPERDEVNGRDFWFVSQARINEIQNGMDTDKFVECRHISGHTYYYSANAIKEVAKQNKHCVLNVGIHSIDRLHSVDLFPIVIFVKFKSAQDIREQFNHRCSIEQAQKVYEKAVKLERGFYDKFSAVFSGNSMEEVYLRIKDYIRDNASNIMWVKA